MRACPQPIVAAIDGVCTGAGAMIACGSDMRLATARSKLAFLFVRVGLAGADMGACAVAAPDRPVARGRSVFTGPPWAARRPSAGFHNRWSSRATAGRSAGAGAEAAEGPTFGHAMTKTMLWQEWNSGLGDHRGRSAGAGHLHTDQGLSAPTTPSPRSEARLRRRLTMSGAVRPGLALLRRRPPARWCRSSERWVADELPALLHGAGGQLGRGVCLHRAAGALAGPRRAAARNACPRPAGGVREQLDVRSLALGREVLARASGRPISRSPCRGPGQRRSRCSAARRSTAPAAGIGRGRIITAFALSRPMPAPTWRR